jgi:hypothetical protein
MDAGASRKRPALAAMLVGCQAPNKNGGPAFVKDGNGNNFFTTLRCAQGQAPDTKDTKDCHNELRKEFHAKAQRTPVRATEQDQGIAVRSGWIGRLGLPSSSFSHDPRFRSICCGLNRLDRAQAVLTSPFGPATRGFSLPGSAPVLTGAEDGRPPICPRSAFSFALV